MRPRGCRNPAWAGADDGPGGPPHGRVFRGRGMRNGWDARPYGMPRACGGAGKVRRAGERAGCATAPGVGCRLWRDGVGLQLAGLGGDGLMGQHFAGHAFGHPNEIGLLAIDLERDLQSPPGARQGGFDPHPDGVWVAGGMSAPPAISSSVSGRVGLRLGRIRISAPSIGGYTSIPEEGPGIVVFSGRMPCGGAAVSTRARSRSRRGVRPGGTGPWRGLRGASAGRAGAECRAGAGR